MNPEISDAVADPTAVEESRVPEPELEAEALEWAEFAVTCAREDFTDTNHCN